MINESYLSMYCTMVSIVLAFACFKPFTDDIVRMIDKAVANLECDLDKAKTQAISFQHEIASTSKQVQSHSPALEKQLNSLLQKTKTALKRAESVRSFSPKYELEYLFQRLNCISLYLFLYYFLLIFIMLCRIDVLKDNVNLLIFIITVSSFSAVSCLAVPVMCNYSDDKIVPFDKRGAGFSVPDSTTAIWYFIIILVIAIFTLYYANIHHLNQRIVADKQSVLLKYLVKNDSGLFCETIIIFFFGLWSVFGRVFTWVLVTARIKKYFIDSIIFNDAWGKKLKSIKNDLLTTRLLTNLDIDSPSGSLGANEW